MNMQNPKYQQKSKSIPSLEQNYLSLFAMRYPVLYVTYSTTQYTPEVSGSSVWKISKKYFAGVIYGQKSFMCYLCNLKSFPHKFTNVTNPQGAVWVLPTRAVHHMKLGGVFCPFLQRSLISPFSCSLDLATIYEVKLVP